MEDGIIFLLIAGASSATYNTLQKVASTHISPPLVSIIASVSLVVVAVLVIFGYRATGQELFLDQKGILFALLIGIAAFGIDFFGILGFSKGVGLNSGAALLGASYVIFVVLLSKFVLGEAVTTQKLAALVLAGIATYLATS